MGLIITAMSFVAINKVIYERDMDVFMDRIMSSSCTEAIKHIRHIREASDKTKTSIIQNVLNAIELFATDPAIQRMLTRKKTIKPELLLQGQQNFFGDSRSQIKKLESLYIHDDQSVFTCYDFVPRGWQGTDTGFVG